jgi:hypothetical protein
MKLLRNTGNDRVIDRLRDWLQPSSAIDLMSPHFSLYAYSETRDYLPKAGQCRILLGADGSTDFLYGGPGDIAARGKLQGRWLAKMAGDWLSKQAEVRHAPTAPPQSMIVVGNNGHHHALTGTCSFTTEGLGVTPGDQLGLIQLSDNDGC